MCTTPLKKKGIRPSSEKKRLTLDPLQRAKMWHKTFFILIFLSYVHYNKYIYFQLLDNFFYNSSNNFNSSLLEIL